MFLDLHNSKSSGGIYEHRFCEQLEFGFCTLKIPVKKNNCSTCNKMP